MSQSTNTTKMWMPIYVADYLADTCRLTTEEHGAYLLLLFDYWRNGALPDDDAVLAQVCRLGPDAWSIHQAVLRSFFKKGEDGLLHQKRIDEELAKAQLNRSISVAKAKKAAEARWGANAPSIAQAVLDQCPSPSPIKTTSSVASAPAKREADPRHKEFKKACEAYAKHKQVTFVWGPSEAKQLHLLLAASPGMTLEVFQRCLTNRAKSDVVHSERPHMWLANVGRFETAPLNKFNQPVIVSQGNGTGPSSPRYIDPAAAYTGAEYDEAVSTVPSKHNDREAA